MTTRFEMLACQQGSTLKDPATEQPMHSAIGPTPEALQIYLGPLKIADRLQQPGPPLVLWDVGLGIAGNAAAALALSAGLRPLEIHSFENELRGLETALASIAAFPHLEPIAPHCRELLRKRETRVGAHRWVLHAGSFTECMALAPQAEAVFFDFYSPRVCGELWSVPVMAALRDHSPRAVLATYSAATPVRLALLLSGWWVGRPGRGAPVTAMKNESTIAWADASLIGSEDQPLGRPWLEKFRSSTQARPYAAAHPGKAGQPDPWSSASFERIEQALLAHPQFRS
jgi:hypothetical protein